MVKLFEVNSFINDVNLFENNIGKDGVEVFGNMFIVNDSLVRIDLLCNGLIDDDI